MHVAATCPVPPSRLVWPSLLVRRSTAASHGFPWHAAGHPPGSPKNRGRTRKLHQSELTLWARRTQSWIYNRASGTGPEVIPQVKFGRRVRFDSEAEEFHERCSIVDKKRWSDSNCRFLFAFEVSSLDRVLKEVRNRRNFRNAGFNSKLCVPST